jgi:hypothetical protein
MGLLFPGRKMETKGRLRLTDIFVSIQYPREAAKVDHVRMPQANAMVEGPDNRSHFALELAGAVCQAGQNVGQIFSNGCIQFAAARDDAENRGDLRSRLFAAWSLSWTSVR